MLLINGKQGVYPQCSTDDQKWSTDLTDVINLLALSSSPPSPHLLGRRSVELELRPSGHQANQLGRPARGLQPAPGKSNTGLPFPPGCVCVCVCVCVRKVCGRACGLWVFTRGKCTYLMCHYCKNHLKGEFHWSRLLGCVDIFFFWLIRKTRRIQLRDFTQFLRWQKLHELKSVVESCSAIAPIGCFKDDLNFRLR